MISKAPRAWKAVFAGSSPIVLTSPALWRFDAVRGCPPHRFSASVHGPLRRASGARRQEGAGNGDSPDMTYPARQWPLAIAACAVLLVAPAAGAAAYTIIGSGPSAGT